MKLVITGVRGFIGSNLALHLASKGHEIVGLARVGENTRFGEVDLNSGELYKNSKKKFSKFLADTDVIIHLGGKRQDNSNIFLKDFLNHNVIHTENLVMQALECGVKKIIFASTIIACPLSSQVPYQEYCLEFPDTMYGISKRLTEYVIDLHTKESNCIGLSLRLAQVFGNTEKNNSVLHYFIKQAQEKNIINVYGNGAAVRDYIYIKDVISAFEAALLSDTPSGVYNIGSDQGYSIKELASAVSEVYLDGNESIQYTPVQKEDQTRYVMDCSKARKHLGWQPGWSLKEALQDMKMGQ